MTSGLKAIETQYKGYRFRSRLEARWAVFFDALGVRWEYEREGYDLDGVLYLPDFWFPDLSCWVEIKGAKPSPSEMSKCTALAEHARQPVHLFWGEVASDPFWSYSTQEHEGKWGAITMHPSCACGQLRAGLHATWTVWHLCHACGAPHISDTAAGCRCRPDWHHCERDRQLARTYPRCYLDESGRRRRCEHDDELARAYAAARSARFEHGENPGGIRFTKRPGPSSYERRLDGWATKVFGETWEDDYDPEYVSERFDRWLEDRGES